MLRSAALAAFAAAAVSAQPSAVDRMVRQTNEVELTNINAQMAAISHNATMDATERMFSAIQQMSADNKAAQDALQTRIDGMIMGVNARLASQNAAISTAIEANGDAASNALDALTASVENTLTTAANEASTAIAAAEAALISRSVSASGQTTTALRAMNSTMVVQLAGKESNTKHFWLGGCSDHNHGCWQDFCLSRVEIDKAQPYFMKRTNTRMRALQTGMFRMQAYFMGTRNWMHVSVFIDGRRFRNTHSHVMYGWWKSDYSDHTFHIAAGKDFWFQGCGHFHNSNNDYHYQRQEFHYVGQRPN